VGGHALQKVEKLLAKRGAKKKETIQSGWRRKTGGIGNKTFNPGPPNLLHTKETEARSPVKKKHGDQRKPVYTRPRQHGTGIPEGKKRGKRGF